MNGLLNNIYYENFYIAGEDSSIHTRHENLCYLLKQSPMQEILNAVDNALSHEFYDRYLHDFVCSLPLDVGESKDSAQV